MPFDVALIFVAAATLAAWLGGVSTKADLLGQFLLQSSMLAIVLTSLAALRRRWARASFGLAVVLAGATLISQPLLPQNQPDGGLIASAASGPSDGPLHPSSKRAAPPASIELLFSNILRTNTRPEAAIERIRGISADVVVLAEVDHAWRQRLQGLHDLYPHGVSCEGVSRCDLAVLSKLPLQDSRVVSDGYTHGYAVLARVETSRGPIEIAGTHLSRPLPLGKLNRQMLQARTVAGAVADGETPLALVGDFNAVPWGRVMGRIAHDGGMRLRSGVVGTWPAKLPWPARIPIDHLLTKGGLEVLEHARVSVPGSDHAAVLARLAR